MLVPAIHFPGTCAEAIAFYQKAFHAEVIHVAYDRDAPPDSGMSVSTETRDHVMHAELVISGTRMNMCDIKEKADPGNMFVFNLFFDSADEVTSAFRQLSENGKIVTELGPQFWTSMYGQVVDRFGIHWQLMKND